MRWVSPRLLATSKRWFNVRSILARWTWVTSWIWLLFMIDVLSLFQAKLQFGSYFGCCSVEHRKLTILLFLAVLANEKTRLSRYGMNIFMRWVNKGMRLHIASFKVRWVIEWGAFLQKLSITSYFRQVGGPSGLRKTIGLCNSLAHRTTWLRSDLPLWNEHLYGMS